MTHAEMKTPWARVEKFAYADNWSFMSTSERACFHAMTSILNLIHDLKMQIDFSKSWCWATTKQFKQFWHDSSALLLRPGFVFQLKSHVHDLGCTISYTNAVVLGPLRDKMDNAVAKCNRLRKLNLALDERGEKIQVAVWPAVFYGALGTYIGAKHFATLRRAAANVLVGEHKHASSHVALHYLTDRVQDPLLYLITDMLTTLRRMFIYYPVLANQCLTSVRAYEGKVKGPASALAAYLRQLKWELTANATLLGPGGLRLHLPGSSNKQIRSQLRIAWDWQCHQEILHRKGVPPEPFDSLHTIRILKTYTDRQRRILSLSLTSGWQSLGGIANWSATQEPQCPWCSQYDTHCHQLLECEAFSDLRTQHHEAVSYMRDQRRLCWFPLPCHHPEVALARQAMWLRHTTGSYTDPGPISQDATIYTDGSCDNTRDPYTARAAWSVIFSHACPADPEHRFFRVLASGHCPGHQTINRSELYALVVAAENILARMSDNHNHFVFVTDSQFVFDIVHAINCDSIHRHPHKHAHWDLIERLSQIWHSAKFQIRKIKSHQSLEQAQTQADMWHIQGNSYADEVAGKVRCTDDPDFSTLCNTIRTHYTKETAILNKVHDYLIDLSLARMLKLEQKQAGDSHQGAPVGLDSRPALLAFHHQLNRLRNWKVVGRLFEHPPEPHRVVFWCSPWGASLTYLIWKFCRSLDWPHPEEAPAPGDQGISWTELAFSFMLWSNTVLPVRLQDSRDTLILPFDDARVTLLPVKQRSVRVLADNFRWIIKHIQTFSRSHLIPQYKKQGASSLTKLGFSPYHEGGFSRRPNLPNVKATYDFVLSWLQTISHNPPYHNEVLMPPLPAPSDPPAWPNLPELAQSQRGPFLIKIRNALARKKDFDEIQHPNDN